VTRFALYLHALRVARERQLRGRALRPFRRRSFPKAPRSGSWAPIDADLWRTKAFAAADDVAGDGIVRLLGKDVRFPPSAWDLPGEPRLRRFHLHYGEDVLGWARRGELAAARSGIESWIAGNPPRHGDPWHPYPLSTRIGNWVAALSLAPELATEGVIDSLARQLAHLERNVEDDVLGNHVVRNARGLVLAGRALGRRAAVDQGLALLERELPEQILPDGGHYERSPVYHLVVLRDLLEVRAATEVGWLDGPIARMSAFSSALARPDGHPALFNDGSLDLAPDLELPAAPPGLAVFPDTGYAVLRDGPLWLAFDCGAPAPAFLPAHAHADGLSFQLWVENRPFVSDPGTTTYEAGTERQRVRSTRAHSTVAVGGRDQFEVWSAFRAGPFPEVRLISTEPLTASVETPFYRHTRTLGLDAAGLDVSDLVECRERSKVESGLLVEHGTPRGSREQYTEDAAVSEWFFRNRSARMEIMKTGPILSADLSWRIECAS
jgi:Heparinase II/III-like protein/Heparinase II/III N-terminus